MECQICYQELKNFKALSTHIQFRHNNEKKEYYDSFMKKDGEGLCKVCNNPTNFTILNRGYEIYCSKKCEKIDYSERMKNNNPLKLESVKQNQRNTNLKRYGVEHNWQIPEVKIKSKKKFRETCLKLYGVENPLQNMNIFDKKCKTGKLIKKFKDTNLWYQGTYELNFLERYYDKFEIHRGPAIRYEKGIYFSDFYIPSLNLVIEIKGSYYLKIHKNTNTLKKQGTLDSGYNFIMIIDKDYTEFDATYLIPRGDK